MYPFCRDTTSSSARTTTDAQVRVLYTVSWCPVPPTLPPAVLAAFPLYPLPPPPPWILPCAGRRSTHAHTHSISCLIRSAEQVIDQIVETNDSILIGTEFVIWCKRDLFITSSSTIYPATVSNHSFHTVFCKDRAAESRQRAKQSTVSAPLRQEAAILYDGAFNCVCNSW